MMKSWKFLTIGLIFVMLFGLFAYAEDAVTITFWHAMSSRHQPNLQKLADDFMAENPNVTVNLVYQGHYGDLQQKINAAVAAGNPPTMAQVYENWTTPLVDVLYPIGPAMTDAEKADIIDGLVPSNTYNGVLVTVPFNKSIMVLYYRKDLVPNPPTTWDEYLQMARDLTVDKDGDGVVDQFGTAFRPSANPEQFLNFLEEAGGSILNDDWTEVTINNEQGLAAMDFAASLAPYSLITSGYLSDPFGAGQICMFIDTSAGYYYNNKAAETGGFEMGVARVPMGPVNQKSMIQGTNIAVFDMNQTQAQKDAAVKFARFLLRPENTVYWAEKGGYQPVTKSAYETEEWESFVASHSYQQAMSAQMLDGFSQILHPNYGDMRQVIGTAFEEVMTGEATPEDALNDAAAQITDLLNE
jgi:ABC-type glycerol-3-phosphate transport system substrate-binding protein